MTDESKTAALRACAEARPSTDTGWHPIETAPRDGTYLLLCNANCQIPPFSMYIGAHRSGLDCEPFSAIPEWRDYGGRFTTPTHWMLLPAAAPKEPR